MKTAIVILGFLFVCALMVWLIGFVKHRLRMQKWNAAIQKGMRLPTAREINPAPHDLDGKCAERHFFGKTLAEAEAMFREAFLLYQEDLMFMGPIGFRFYVQAAINCIQSDAAAGDADMINSFAGILEHRLEFEAQELIPIAPQLASVCRYILERYDRFDVTPEVYGDLAPRFQVLAQTFLPQGRT